MEKWSVSLSGKGSAPLLKGGGKILARAFYNRETSEVAVDLLGKILWVRDLETGSVVAGRIVETEVYHGEDPASHSARGLTPRTAPMFEAPGIAYVYFIYGMYEMLNFVTERKGYPAGVLIRALEPLVGLEEIARNRAGVARRDWTNGPGRLCRAMGIRMTDNRQPLTGPRLTVTDDGFRPEAIHVSPRVGIRVGVDEPWRFYIADHPDVSRVPQNRVSRLLTTKRGSRP